MVHNSEINSIDQNNAENTDIVKLEVGDSSNINLPEGNFIGDAALSQDGQNLVLEFSEVEKLTVEDYFAEGNDFIIEDSNGGILNEGLVNSFLQSSPEYAQASSMTDESPVGAVEEIKGSATVTRADGSNEDITLGTPIYQGDVIQTSGDGAVNIMFVDETSMAISESARIAVDKYEFDAATESGVTDLSVLRGVFVYTSGLIGRDDPDDVIIETPVGSIGIRGTIIAGNINPKGESEISVLEGAIVVTNGTGETTLSQQFETVKLSGFQNRIEYKGVEAANDIGKTYGSVSDVLPKLFSSINDTKNDEQRKSEESKADKKEEINSSEEEVENKSQEQNDADIENTDTTTEQVIETGLDSPNEFANIEKTSDSNKIDNSIQKKSSLPSSKNSLTQNKISSIDQVLYQEAKDFTPEPKIIKNLKPLYEESKMGTVVGDFVLNDYPAGTLLKFDVGGNTQDTVGEFDITQVPGTNKFEITLNVDIGAAGSTLTPLNIVALLPNGNTTLITLETPIIEDAVVNLKSAGGFEYNITDGTPITNSGTIDIGDINNDGIADTIVGNPNFNSAQGQVTIMNGGIPITIDNPTPYNGDLFGFSVAGIGDFDGDGKNDFIIGAKDNTNSGISAGASFIHTNVSNFIKIDGIASGTPASLDFSKFVTGIGDFNGDSLSDVLIGSNEGVTIIYGSNTLSGQHNNNNIASSEGFNINIALSSPVSFGSTGDINGDGFDDFAISFENGNDVNTYVIYGRENINANLTLTDLENPDHALKINHKGASTQEYQIHALGDKNGDGFDDIQLGIKNGEQFIVYGEAGGSAHIIVTDNMLGFDNSSNTAGLITASANYQSLVGDVDFFDGGTGGSNHTDLRMSGGKSNNNFKISHNQFDRIDGGDGFDTITVFQNGNSIDFSDFNFEQIQSIEQIEFGGTGQTITLTAENIFNLLKTSENGELKISGPGTVNFDAVTATGMQDFLAEASDITATDVTYTSDTDGPAEGGLVGYFGYHIGGYDLYIEADPAAATTVNFV